MRHKLFLTLFLFYCGIGAISIQSQTLLGIKKVDGTEKFLGLSTLNKITFSDVNLYLNYIGGNSESLSFSSVRKIVFSTVAGVNNTLADTKVMQLYPNPAANYIFLKNAPEGDLSAAIYSVTGSQVLNICLGADVRQIEISCLPKGLYLLKVNNQVVKFSKL